MKLTSVVPTDKWLTCAALALLILITARSAHAQLPHGIPEFCATSTITSVGSGSWSSAATWSPARVPAAGDVVRIAAGSAVTYDQVSDASLACVGVYGTLRFRADINTRLKVGTLMVMPQGTLQLGTAAAPVAAAVTAEVIIANRPIDTTSDPEQYGTGLIGLGTVTMHGAQRMPTFVRLAAEPRAAQTTLTLAEPVSGWRVGDRIVLPDTRQLNADERFAKLTPQFEEFTISAIAGTQITLNRAITFNHDGARNAQNVLEILPHIGNVTRNIVIRSENPAGTRGHTMYVHRAAVDIRFVLFKDLGRTTNAAIGASNPMGRYPLHIHHVFGPDNPSNTGYQFTLVGNAVADSRKWPLTVHNSHYGLIRDNVVFNGVGSGIVAEDGNESYNEFVHNFGVGIFGDANPRDMDGRDGSIFWFNGFNHIIRDNVAANAVNRSQNIVNGAGYNFTWAAGSSANTRIPLFRGADTTVAGQYRLVNMQLTPIIEFSGNEAYGAMPTGLVIWHLGTDGYAIPTMTESVLRNFTGWHLHESAFFGYPVHNVTLDGFVVRGHRRALGQFDGGSGFWTGDYKARNVIIRRANIQGMSLGLDGSTATEGSFLIENSYFSNWRTNISMDTLATPGTGATPNPRTTIIRNTVFDPMQGATGFTTINMDWSLSRANSHPNIPDRLFVYDYDGVLGSNFQVFYTEQGSQNIAGGTAPCSATRPEIRGLVCPHSANAPTLSALSPTSGPSGGGTVVTISGANFAAGARVEFGGIPATNVTVASATRITATTPSRSAGLVSLNVTNPDGQRGRLPEAFAMDTASPPPCSYALDSTATSVAAAGGSRTVTVSSASGCAWTAASNATWITVASGSSGSGTGTVQFSVASNTGAARSGTLTIAGQTFTVTQEAAAAQTCTYAVSPASHSIAAAGGTATSNVTTAAGCTWTATSNVPWVTVTAGSPGNGSGAVTISVAANTVTTPRSGTVTVQGQTITVNQAAAAPTCAFTVSPTAHSVASVGGSVMSTVSAAAECAWTAASNAPWLTIGAGASGSGNGSVTVNVASNVALTSRSGTVTIAGQTVTVNQDPVSCIPKLSTERIGMGRTAGTQTVAVEAPADCSWSATSPAAWLTIPSGASGTGNGTITLSATSNGTAGSRTAAVDVSGKTLTVTQARRAAARKFDFDGNSVDDVLLYDPNTGNWSMQIGVPEGFAHWSGGTWATGLEVRAADFDGNGLSDVLLHAPATGQWTKVLNPGTGTVSTTTGTWMPRARIQVLDFNADGRTDVFVYDPASGAWTKAIGTSTAMGPFTLSTGTWQPGLETHVAELNGDTRPDLLAYDPATGSWFKALNTTNSTFTYVAGSAAWWSQIQAMIEDYRNGQR